MRKISMLFSILVVTALLITACGGEETTTSVPPVTQDTTSTSEPSTTETGVATSATMDTTTTPGVPVTGEDNPARVSNELTFQVVDQNGEQVGNVEDLVLDFDNQMVSYVVVGTGGFMDLGEKTLLVPWDMLQLPDGTSTSASGQANAFVFLGDTEMLKNATSVDVTTMLPERGQSAADWDADIRNFWESGGTGGSTGTGTQAATTGTAAPNMTATTTTGTGLATSTPSTGGNHGNSGGTGTDQGMALQGVMLATEVIGSTINVNQNQGQGQGTGQGQGQGLATNTPAGATVEATATLTTGTGNGTGNGQESVAAMIEDVIVDPATGDIQYLVITATFDDGDHLIPVPFKFFKWDAGTQTLTLPMNGMAIQNAPVFQGGEFPDMSTEGWDSEFNDFWNNGGSGSGGTGGGSGTIPSATPTP